MMFTPKAFKEEDFETIKALKIERV